MTAPKRFVRHKDYIDETEAGLLYKQRQAEKQLNSTLWTNYDAMKVFYDRAAVETDKIKILKDLAEVVVDPISIETLIQRRRNFDKKKNASFPLANAICWVCDMPAEIRHHVVLLKNGGSATGKRNVIYLCNRCHAEVHPWLVYTKANLLPDYNLANQKNNATTLFEKAAKGKYKSYEEAEKRINRLFA